MQTTLALDYYSKKRKNLFIDEMPSLHKELEKIFFNFNPKYTSKYEAKIVVCWL
nr:hypothetical protein [Mycoplasmopsis bovis]